MKVVIPEQKEFWEQEARRIITNSPSLWVAAERISEYNLERYQKLPMNLRNLRELIHAALNVMRTMDDDTRRDDNQLSEAPAQAGEGYGEAQEGAGTIPEIEERPGDSVAQSLANERVGKHKVRSRNRVQGDSDKRDGEGLEQDPAVHPTE